MSFFFIILNFIFVNNAAAINCSSNRLIVAYINDQLNSELEASRTASRMNDLLELELLDEKGITSHNNEFDKIRSLYNETSFNKDFINSAVLKISESIMPDFRNQKIINRILGTFLFRRGSLASLIDIYVPDDKKDELIIWFNNNLMTDLALKNYDLFINVFKPLAQADRKILVIAHSQGTLYANQLKKDLSDIPVSQKLKRNTIRSVLLAPAASVILRNTKNRDLSGYILNQYDFINIVSRLTANIFPSLSDSLRLDPIGHNAIDIYLNRSISARFNNLNKSMADHFKSTVRSIVDDYPSTDTSRCCGVGSWGNFISEKSCEEMSCMGGFIDTSVSVARNSLVRIDNESSLCGNFEIPATASLEIKKSSLNYFPDNKNKKISLNGNVFFENSEFNFDPFATVNNFTANPEITIRGINQRVTIEGMPKLSGDIEILDGAIYGRPEITGKVRSHGTVITDGNHESKRLRLTGNGVNGIYLYESFVTGSPLLERNLTVNNSTVEGEGTYRGAIDGLLDSFGGPVSSVMAGGNTFDGTNNFAGVFLLQSGVKDSILYNDFIESPSRFQRIWVANQTAQRSNMTLKGEVTVLANVANGVTYESYNYTVPSIGPIGININSSSSINGIKKITGPLFMDASQVKCTNSVCENIEIFPTASGFHTFFERANLEDVEVKNGAVHVRDTPMKFGKISIGSSVVFSSNLTNVQVLNSSCVIGRTLSNRILNRLGCEEEIPLVDNGSIIQATQKHTEDFSKTLRLYQ